LPENITSILALPGGAPVVPTVHSYFGEENDPKNVPELVQANNLGGWFKIQDTVKKSSYHKDLQYITSKIVQSGCIYQTVVQIGSIDEELPSEAFEQILGFTRKSPPSSLESATIILFNMGGKLSTNDPDGRNTSRNSQV
jgi:hypothetical protein